MCKRPRGNDKELKTDIEVDRGDLPRARKHRDPELLPYCLYRLCYPGTIRLAQFAGNLFFTKGLRLQYGLGTGFQELHFAHLGEPGLPGVIGRPAAQPIQRVADGVDQRANGEARLQRLGDRDLHEPGVGLVAFREPERQVGPGLDLVPEQERLVGPRDFRLRLRNPGAGGEKVAHVEVRCRPGGLERAARLPFQQRDHPHREVAHVDELQAAQGLAGRQHHAARGDAPRPVAEAVGGIVRADDQAGPDHQRAFAECLAYLVFAERFQRPVGFRRHRFRAAIAERCDRRVFGDVRHAHVGIDRNRGDEEIAADAVAQRRRALRRDGGNVSAGVDRRVPAAPGEGFEALRAIADEGLDARVRRAAAIEVGDGMPARERGISESTADEDRAAENEEPHFSARVRRRAGGQGQRISRRARRAARLYRYRSVSPRRAPAGSSWGRASSC